jgi:peptidase S41-like protein
MMRLLIFLAGVTLLQVGPQSGFGATQREDVVKSLSSLLVERYVDEATGKRVAATLQNELQQGAFDSLTNQDAFAAAITDLLQRETHDRHLFIWHRDGAAARLLFAVFEGPMVSRSEILPGNIGYIDVRHFIGNTAEFDAAMNTMKEAAALVIDLRQCAGGDREQVRHLSSYLFAKPTRLISRQARTDSAPLESWTRDDLPGARFTNPVYVLTSHQTFSAAEAFALGLRASGRAVLVGETTGGGGHFVQGFPQLPHGFQIVLAVGRNMDPRSGKSWEGDGLVPDLTVNPEQALQAAIGHFHGWRR